MRFAELGWSWFGFTLVSSGATSVESGELS
jgi:hypothetical protein